MDKLSEAFHILTFIGLWKSDKWETWKCILYYCYTSLLAYHFITFFFFGLLGLILFSNNIIDLVNNSSMIITMFTVLGKMFTIISYRKKIISFMNELQGSEFQSKNRKEEQLNNKCRKFVSFNTSVYVAFVQASAIIFHINKIYESHRKGSLPYKAWYPYDISSIHIFTSYQQVITVFLCANVNVAFDALLLGMMVLICLQVNILKCRFHKMLNELEKYTFQKNLEEKKMIEKVFFRKFVTLHNSILRLVDHLTHIFSLIIFVQFVSSALILCTSIYVLSQTPVYTSDFLACLMYILCMFFQIFFPCLIGHQMTIEFAELSNDMYNTNWYTLSNNVQKCMNLIMIKSSKPIVFTTGYVISLSLDAFKSLLKLSYTIFNVFQQSS